jgi:hypothetical protein
MPAGLPNGHNGLGLAQKAKNLLFGKALLHVQSPSRGGLDSKPSRYSNLGRSCKLRAIPFQRQAAATKAVTELSDMCWRSFTSLTYR